MIRQDLHIHTHLSSCSRDPLQTPANILEKAEELQLDQICLTDHFWESSMPGASVWYKSQNMQHIRESLIEMPDSLGGVEIFFGCETEYAGGNLIGISYQTASELDFVLVPISHFHMEGFVRPPDVRTAKEVADLWMERYRGFLDLDLPWTRIGLAHVLNCCIGEIETEFLSYLMREPLAELFTETAEKGIAMEINGSSLFDGAAAEMHLELYGVMKECGCRFTMGSDAHGLERMSTINKAFEFAEILGLDDDDMKMLT